MDKREFRRRLERAGERARLLATKLVLEELPTDLAFDLPRYDDPQGARGPDGTIKFLGGRFLKPEALQLLRAARTADLLWTDGKCPAWVNVFVADVTDGRTRIQLLMSRMMVVASESNLPVDISVDPDDPIEPFRVRGPRLPEGWRSVELDGRVLLRRTRDF